MAWEIIFYKTPDGHPVVQNFIDDLPEIPRTKLVRKIDLLEEYWTQLGMPHSRPMGGGLLELRVHGKQDVRVLYAFATERRIYLLHVFVKKQQATPRHEINIALKRKAEVEKL